MKTFFHWSEQRWDTSSVCQESKMSAQLKSLIHTYSDYEIEQDLYIYTGKSVYD